MAFDRLLDLALQPTALMLDPAQGRAQFLADLNRTHGLYAGLRIDDEQRQLRARDDARRQRHSQPAEYGQRVVRHEHPDRPFIRPAHGYMVDAILRDNALAEYDRQAPQRRKELT